MKRGFNFYMPFTKGHKFYKGAEKGWFKKGIINYEPFFKKGMIPWNKGKNGLTIAWNKGTKCFKLTGKNNGFWKGDSVGYFGLHSWVYRHKGKPQFCEHCGTTDKLRRLNWANIDHKYHRNLDDFISLCYSCHKIYDLKNNLPRFY